MPKYCRSDKCQDTVVKELRQMGAMVLIVSQYKIGFDIIVGMFGMCHNFELKNRKKDKLTTNEKDLMQTWPEYVSRAHTTEEICSIMAHLAGRKF